MPPESNKQQPNNLQPRETSLTISKVTRNSNLSPFVQTQLGYGQVKARNYLLST
jgi:hypothetical protein